MADELALDRADGIAVITMRAAERRNALTVTMAEAMTAAARLGLAWAAPPAAEVESSARRLAAVPASDPELARRTARSMRTIAGPPAVSWAAALEIERASQMWSMRRRDLAS
jgi:enoyl-CoA hydratase/carnithine racemase